MTAKKVFSVFNFYAEFLTSRGVKAENKQHTSEDHLLYMCEYMSVLLGNALVHLGKAMRWLGFVQGVLAAKGLFTVAELRTHSKSEDSACST